VNVTNFTAILQSDITPPPPRGNDLIPEIEEIFSLDQISLIAKVVEDLKH
jgi:hypothetical protein